jgi:predicted metal-binding membrane protein
VSTVVAGRPRAPISRGQLALIGALLVLAAIGWFVTDRRMAGMDAGPGTDLGTLGFYTSAWVVMMAAMMFPSIWPMVLGYRFVARRRVELGHTFESGSTALFVLGYLAVWTGFGFLAYGLFDGVRSLSIDALNWHHGGPYLAGGVLVVAAIYQLTPAKDVCLTRCRSPFEFLTESWRDGRIGALRMGAVHGAWCVGCCWALMAALFALGIMSLGWMVFVSAIIAAEKLLPWKAHVNRVVAVALAALGVAVALSPSSVPGLTLPDSAAAQRAMSRMGGGGMRTGGAVGGAMRMHGGGAMRMRGGGDGAMRMRAGAGGAMRGYGGGGGARRGPQSMTGR